MITVASLHIYPVKSCRGIAVERAAIDRFGLAGDRRFLVVDQRRQFLTQRTVPALALIEAHTRDGALELRAPHEPAVQIKTAPPHEGGSACEVVIWRDTVRARDLGDAAAAWLTRVLAQPVRLVGMDENFSRPVRRAAEPDDHTAFTDGQPILMVGEESLADLNARLDEPLPMNRFRPNIVLRGAPAYAEDSWQRIRIGNVVLRASGPCARCVVPTTDQQTLARTKEPLRTLAFYRRGPEGEVYFGCNYIHESKSGEVAVGDAVEVIVSSEG